MLLAGTSTEVGELRDKPGHALSMSGPLESSVNSSLLDGSSSEEMEDDDIDEIRQLEARLQELRRKKGRSMARKTVSQ